MNSLLSLPRWNAASRRSTAHAARRHDPACRPSQRLAMARQLAHALRGKRVSPVQVADAVRGGDRHVARLLWSSLPTLPLPAFPHADAPWMAEPFTAPAPHLPDALRALTGALLRRLAASGDVSGQALRACADAPSLSMIGDLLCEGWNNRVRRVLSVLDRLVDDLPSDMRPQPLFACVALELSRLLPALRNDLAAYSSEAEVGITIEQVNFDATSLPANPVTEPGWYKTLVTAWNQMASRGVCGLLGPVCDDLIYLAGCTGELIEDVVDRSARPDGTCVVSAQDLERLDDEIGWSHETAIDMINDVGASSLARKSAMKGRHLPANQRSRAQARLVRRLRQLESVLSSVPVSSADWRFEHSDTAMHSIGPLVYADFGRLTGSMVDDHANYFYESETYVSIFPESDDPVLIDRCCDRAILEAGVACLAVAELERYRHDCNADPAFD